MVKRGENLAFADDVFAAVGDRGIGEDALEAIAPPASRPPS